MSRPDGFRELLRFEASSMMSPAGTFTLGKYRGQGMHAPDPARGVKLLKYHGPLLRALPFPTTRRSLPTGFGWR